MNSPLHVRFIPKLAFWLVLTNLVLLAPSLVWVSTGFQIIPDGENFRHSIRWHFEPNVEDNLFTWYSSFLLILAALAALVNFWLDGQWHRVLLLRYAWLGLFLLAIALSIEEVAQIHESLATHASRWSEKQGSWSWLQVRGKQWIIVYLPGILAATGFLFFTYIRMFQEHRGPRTLALLGLFLWIFALVLEFFYIDIGLTWGRWWVALESVLEEGFEMFGSTTMVIAFSWYAQERFNRLMLPEVASVPVRKASS